MARTSPAAPTWNPPNLARELGELVPGALLLLAMSGAVVYALSVSGWAPGLELLRPMALLGLVVGVIFARLRWLPAWLAHLLSAALALTWAVHLLGALLDERLLTWRDQASEVLIRGLLWARVLAAGGRGEDIVLFVLALCLLVWVVAYGTAWAVLRKGQVWRPIIFNAVIALVNYTYVQPKPTLAFFVFLGAALLLLVYQHVLQRQALWDAHQIEYPDLLPLRFLWSAALVCGTLIALTAMLPGSVSVDRATRSWELLSSPFRAAREQWEDMFSTISAPPGAGSGAFTARGALLGGARQLSDEVVMTVRSTRYDYWRAVAFDRYTGAGWENTTGEQARAALGAGTAEQARTPRAADEPIPLGDIRGRRAITQTFTLARDRLDDLVIVGGAAQSVSLATLVEHNYRDDGSGLQANFDDTALIVAAERLRAGNSYTVTALMSFADVASLRAAGNEYPQWVRERYLQLPDTVSERTRSLAARIVAEAGASTAYDQALIIQDYLRSLRYNELIGAPPAGGDLVDWFLFEQREGYCDYFASAMVVMLRAQGIPARWVRGYAGGEFDADQGLYTVRERVAHSWPEVYFPGFGWERFEPTPADYTTPPQRPLSGSFGPDANDALAGSLVPPPDTRAAREELDEGLTPARTPVTLPTTSPAAAGYGQSLAILGSMLAVLALAAGAIGWRWRAELRGLRPAARAYAAMALLASWSGLGQQPQQTPLEYGETLGALLPAHRHTIRAIARAYAAERYRGRQTSLPPASETRELQVALLRQRFTRFGERQPPPGDQ